MNATEKLLVEVNAEAARGRRVTQASVALRAAPPQPGSREFRQPEISAARDPGRQREHAQLGYIFIPFEVPAENTWVVVPGYRRARLDFAYTRRKTKLERQ